MRPISAMEPTALDSGLTTTGLQTGLRTNHAIPSPERSCMLYWWPAPPGVTFGTESAFSSTVTTQHS